MIDWTVNAERVCRAVASEELGAVYLLDDAALPPAMRRNDCKAWHASRLDLAMEPRLRAAGKWRGPGFAAAFNLPLCIGPDDLPEIAAKVLTTYALHELAHHLDSLNRYRRIAARFGVPYTGLPDERLSPDEVNALQHALAQPFDDDAAPWDGHDVPYIRACGHIAFRAQFAGHYASIRILNPVWWAYRLSSPHDYQATLAQEVAERVDEPISLILTTPAPQALLDLFASDTTEEPMPLPKKKTTLPDEGPPCNSCGGHRATIGVPNRVREYARRSGRTYYRCSVCGHTFSIEPKPALSTARAALK